MFTLPKNFLLGVATCATQIEGGDCAHTWADWAARGGVKDGTSPERANDHWNRFAEDTALMSDLKIQIYRFGIEWARIEPVMGVFDEESIAHYREELLYLKRAGIQPLLTLHHFTNPLWFEQLGGFEKLENKAHFLRFVEKAIRSFGDLVSEYITINEPNIYAVNGYFLGMWPPGKRSFSRAMQVMTVLTACHIEAYSLIHRVRAELGFSDTKVSFANHLRVFDPANPKNIFHKACAHGLETCFQAAMTKAMCLGKFSFPIGNPAHLKPGVYADFSAINYYTRSTISGFSDGVRKNAPVNDLGWEIYPDGIVVCAKMMLHFLPDRPIYITENGTCDTNDTFRCRYLYEHLKAIADSKLSITRYYHWCFIDNFEWAEGESARFGIVHVDYPTQTRSTKQSGLFYQKIIEQHGVTEEMYRTYVAGVRYPGEQ